MISVYNKKVELFKQIYIKNCIETATRQALEAGKLTGDIAGEGVTPIGCSAMATEIIAGIKAAP
jgi:hypothetical protein